MITIVTAIGVDFVAVWAGVAIAFAAFETFAVEKFVEEVGTYWCVAFFAFGFEGFVVVLGVVAGVAGIGVGGGWHYFFLF